MQPRPRLLTVVPDPPDRREVEQLLLDDDRPSVADALERARVEAARVRPVDGPSNVVPFRPRKTQR